MGLCAAVQQLLAPALRWRRHRRNRLERVRAGRQAGGELLGNAFGVGTADVAHQRHHRAPGG